jgi:tetratricopeptide (TPR) repeat protein
MGLLELAAVLGREFNFDVLLHMAPGVDEDTLLDAVEDLLRARLLEEVQHSHEDRYRFVHNKIQEVIYARASRRRLRRWHRDAGQALEKVYAGRLERVIEPLARHFLEAGDRRGVGYGLRAGDAARAVYANREALWYYGRALELAAGLRERGENGELAGQVVALHSGMAGVHFLIGEYGAASACYWTVLELLPEAKLEADERRQRTAATHRRLADVYEAQGRYDEALAELHAAQAALQVTVGTSRELALIYQAIGWLQRRQGNYREAIVSCDEGKRVAPPDDHAVVAELDDTLGVIHRTLGEYDHAAACHQRSLALRERLDDQAGIAKTCNNLALVSWQQGDHEQAIVYNRRSLDISERIGHVTGVAWLHNNLGNLYYAQGEYNQAIDSYHRALTTHERIGNQLGIVTALGNLGWARLKQGGLARAVEYAQAALDKSVEIGDREGVTSTHHLLAEIYLAQGDPAQAIHSGQQALEIATDIGARLYQAEAHQVLGQACTELGQRERACTHIEAAWRIFCALGDEERATATKETLDTLNCQGEREDINE